MLDLPEITSLISSENLKLNDTSLAAALKLLYNSFKALIVFIPYCFSTKGNEYSKEFRNSLLSAICILEIFLNDLVAATLLYIKLYNLKDNNGQSYSFKEIYNRSKHYNFNEERYQNSNVSLIITKIQSFLRLEDKEAANNPLGKIFHFFPLEIIWSMDSKDVKYMYDKYLIIEEPLRKNNFKQVLLNISMEIGSSGVKAVKEIVSSSVKELKNTGKAMMHGLNNFFK
jgi:hypothetical protein